jgi:Cu/Ag efflux protein CusF
MNILEGSENAESRINHQPSSYVDARCDRNFSRHHRTGACRMQHKIRASALRAAGQALSSRRKIVSIDQQQASVMVDGQEIVGFMAAMTMPYSVRDPKLLAPLGPGDEITADIVVTDDGAYLENIVVTKKGDGKGSTGTSNPPKARDSVLDFAMIN